MSAASDHILRHTTAFASETLSQPTLRRRLVSVFRQKHPPFDQNILRPLNLAAETLENAISTTNISVKTSSIRLAEKLLNSYPQNPFSSFLLSLIYHLQNRPIDSALCLLELFYSNPSLARSEIAPVVFEELFLVHFVPVLEWYNEQRSRILASLPKNGGYDSDDQSIDVESVGVSCTTLLSKMNGEQALELKALERDYEDVLDENCKAFVWYFKEVVENEDGEREIDLPDLVLERVDKVDEFDELGDEDDDDDDDGERIEADESGLKNGRYNPIWAEEQKSTEFKGSITKNLSKFPSFFPERVSLKVLTNQKSSRKSRRQSFKKYSDSEMDETSVENSYSYSDSEEEVDVEEKDQSIADSRQIQPLPQEQHSPAESSRSPDQLMPDNESSPGGEKNAAPKDFVCPITSNIFDDPVTLETGQTYERTAIQEWIDRGNSTCPITRQKLSGTQLPKTNYVLKRLIVTWREQNESRALVLSKNQYQENEPNFSSGMPLASPDSVISQATMVGTVGELRLAIKNLCVSEILKESEMAVLRIEWFWREANIDVDIQSMLSKPPVINGFVEILFNSVDARVLKATVYLLSELGSRDETVIQTLTRVDSDVECIVALFKKGLLETVVLVYLLGPAALSLFDKDVVNSLVAVLRKKEDDVLDMFMRPKSAAVLLLGKILGNAEQGTVYGAMISLVSEKVIGNVVSCLEAEGQDERVAAIGILLRCMQEDGKCRNFIADKAELAPVLESFLGAKEEERFQIVQFLSELVKLNRRTFNEQILNIIKDEGTFSTMHTFLIYLQTLSEDQGPVVAGLLLQLDLLVEPRKPSIYREEAIDTLISCLRKTDFPAAQLAAAKTILALQGRFSYSGEPLARAFLLKSAGLDKSYKSLIQKDHLPRTTEESEETMEELAAEEWEKKMVFVLVSHEFGLLFEALTEGIKSKNAELSSACFLSATWLVHMLTILPDTGIQGAARVCLLKHLVSIFKSAKDMEDRALSMLALSTFIRDPEGLRDLTPYVKDLLKGLRELKKSSTVALEMLKVFSEGNYSSNDMWNHKELVQEDCSVNGEVLSIVCFKDKIFSGHSDGTIKVWTGKGNILQIIQETREHTKAVTSLSIAQSGDRLYSGSHDKTVRAWSVSNENIQCEQVYELKDHVNSLAVMNKILCFIPQGAGVKVNSWNGASKLLNPKKYVKCLTLVHGKLYCGCQDSSIQEIDLATGTISTIQSGSRHFITKTNPIYALQVYDGQLYSASYSVDGAALKIWSTSNYSMVGSVPSTLEVRSMAISSDIIYLGGKGGIVEVWCRKKFERKETLLTGTNGKIVCMALDTDEDIVVAGTSDGRIQAWGLS